MFLSALFTAAFGLLKLSNLASSADCSQQAPAEIKHLVFLGDSYTDQSRIAGFLENGTLPGRLYESVYPPYSTAANGGYAWPWYLGLASNATIWNYGASGAACDETLTPLWGAPDVLHGQQDWFVLDHLTNENNEPMPLDLDPAEFVVIQWVGTNDIGVESFATNDQPANVTFEDVARCQIASIKQMYKYGARRFVLNSLVPLEFSPAYNGSSAPNSLWPEAHDGALWNVRVAEAVRTVNELLQTGVEDLNSMLPGASVEYFDTYGFFMEMIENPTLYFNGSIAPVTNDNCQRFVVNGTSTRCPDDQRDSFLWFDEVHPSEQAGRNVAQEVWKKLNGLSQY